MSDPIMGGGLHDLRHVTQHFYYDAKKRNESTAAPLAFMGAITVGIGCKMLWEAWKQTHKGHHRFPDHGRSR